MKPSNALLVALSIFIFCIALTNCRTAQTTKQQPLPTPDDALVIYGKHIYNKNRCGSCHTLSFKERTDQLTSLDGVGEVYPVSWIHSFVPDPRSLNPETNMPSYPNLAKRKLNKEGLNIAVSEMHGVRLSATDLITYWEGAIRQSDTLLSQLEEEGFEHEQRTELLALTAYLKSIKPTKALVRTWEKERSDRKKLNKKRDKKWERALKKPNSVLYSGIDKPESIKLGKAIFNTNCSICHGKQGQGSIGPNLTDDYWLHGSSPQDIVATIINGVPRKGMISWKAALLPEEVGQVAAYVISIRGSNPPNPKAPQGIKE